MKLTFNVGGREADEQINIHYAINKGINAVNKLFSLYSDKSFIKHIHYSYVVVVISDTKDYCRNSGGCRTTSYWFFMLKL